MAVIVDFIKYKSELLASMTEMERFVKDVGKRIAFVDINNLRFGVRGDYDIHNLKKEITLTGSPLAYYDFNDIFANVRLYPVNIKLSGNVFLDHRLSS